MLSKKIVLVLSIIFFSSSIVTAQEEMTWYDLSDVKFNRVYNEEYGTFFLVPEFGETIRSLDGKKVRIVGYFLDIAGNGEVLLLSKQPMASCFFCGGAGPETVIEVNFKEKPDFITDQVIVITGTLKLNADDVDQCNYIMNDVTGELIDY